MAKKRIDWLDIAKGVTMILVIVGHTVNNPSPVRTIIFSFHMPLFFLLAGYTFRVKPWKEVLSSSLTRLLVPYLLLALSWRIPLLLASGAPLNGSAIGGLLGTLLFASGTVVQPFGFNAVGPTWFLVALFVSRLALNGLLMLFERLRASVPMQGLVCAAIAVAGLAWSNVLGVYLPLDIDLCYYTVLLMWIGYMARKHNVPLSLGTWYVAVGALLVWAACMQFSSLELAARRLDNPVVATFGAIAGTYVMCWLSMALEHAKNLPVLGTLERFLVFCGNASMAIFCVHAIDWMFPWSAFPQIMVLPFAGAIASVIRSACDIALAYVIKKA